ncbi:MAG: S-layer homology domain-containing protein [Clostridia bacterium]|nr:S-layer homology domain-containing protein [Clostridia bacterium]
MTNGEYTYVYFKTSTAGDYCVEFTAFSAYVNVYDVDADSYVEWRDTEWYAGNEYGWQQRECLALSLEANTTYLLAIDPYDPTNNNTNPTSVSMKVSKYTYAVEYITVEQPSGKFDCYNILDQNDFEYNITFDDNTSGVYEYEELCAWGGYDIDFEDCGTYIEFNNEYIMRAIDTPVFVGYKGYYTEAIASYTSVTDNLKANGVGIFDLDNNYATVYSSQGNGENLFWRIKANSTGYYYWTSYNDSISKLYDYSAVMIDEQNNIVKFDEKTSTWPLVAGREYAFNLYRVFNSNATSYSFCFYKDVDTIYPDTSKSGWYHDSVTYVTGRGIMSGYSNGKFGTSDGIQRQDFLVMLARLGNVELSAYDYDSDFPDVANGSYYEAAVNWGAEWGIVTGYQNGKFGVSDKITREQIVTFLYRYAGNYCGRDTSVSAGAQSYYANKYTDYRNVSSYAQEPMLWALENGVLSGKTSTTIVPLGNAQRCEVAKIMYNVFLNDIF